MIEDIVEGCYLSSDLPVALRELLISRSSLICIARGDCLWTASTPAKSFAILGKGIVQMTRKSPQGKEIVVEILGPGSCAGILATFANSDYPLTSTAVTDVWYLKVPNDTWREMVDLHPKLLAAMVNELTPRLIQGFEFMADMISADVEQRISIALLRVLDLMRPKFGNELTVIPITRLSLAEMAATTAESAIRTTSKWQKLGWIETGHRSIQVIDEGALRRLLSQPFDFNCV